MSNPDDRTMHQWNPEDYAKHSAAQLAWARELIARLDLRGDESVLDIGCGDGKVTAEIAAALPRGYVVGLDGSREMIEFAQAHYPPGQFPNLEFVGMDARQIRLERSFDLIFSNAALHWIEDHLAVLKGVSRVMRQGARLIISCGGRGNAVEILKAVGAVTANDRWRKYFQGFAFPYHFYGPEEYRHWLPQAGLTPLRVELLPKDMIHPGADGLAAWIRTTWLPFTERVPESEREKMIQDVVSEYLHRFPADASGNVRVKMVRLEAEALKV
jgi:trans-aconitate 2-methyltransferase